MGKLEDELMEMEKALEEPQAGVDDPRTDPPGTDPPGTSAPGTEAPGTEAPGTEAPGTAAPGTSAPSTDPPEEDPRDVELRELRERIAKLEGPKTKPPTTTAPSTDPPISEEDFLGDLDIEDVSRDPKLFNQLLNKLRKSSIELTRSEVKQAVESVVRSIPDIVKNNVALTTTLKKVNEEFYTNNEDLKPWKKTVAAVFEEKVSENPNRTYKELLPEVATEVRNRLGLQKKALDKDTPPKLPRKKGGPRQQSKPDVSDLEKEFDEMDKALGLD